MSSSSATAPALLSHTIVQTNVPQTEDELPDYTPDYEASPAYAAETFNQPLITYHLRATKKDTSHFVSFEPATSNTQPSYEINYRPSTTLTLFNRKPDISVSRVPPSSSGGVVAVVARAEFHDNGPFPYYPRARMTLNTSTQHRQDATIEMQSRDWNNWTFTHDSHPYMWTLCDMPRCIELQTSTTSTNGSPPVIARFTYGKVGTKALAGGEVGQLSIWRDALSESVEGREVVVVGCLVVIKYFDGLGRVYRNDGDAGSGAVALINARANEGTRVRSRFLLF